MFTKVCHPKHAQNFCSKGCHFGVACIGIACTGIARGQRAMLPKFLERSDFVLKEAFFQTK